MSTQRSIDTGHPKSRVWFASSGRAGVVQRPVNANPELKVNQAIHFSCLKMFFNAHVLCSTLIEYDGLEKINHEIK